MLYMPDLTQFMQEMTSKDQERSHRTKSSTLKRASSSKELVRTLLVRFQHASMVQAARLSEGSSLKCASSREQPFCTLSGRFPKVQAARLSDRSSLKRASSRELPFCTLLARCPHAQAKFVSCSWIRHMWQLSSGHRVIFWWHA